MAKEKSKRTQAPSKKKAASKTSAAKPVAAGPSHARNESAIKKAKPVLVEKIESPVKKTGAIEAEIVEPELVESERPGPYDPDELRAELESMREVSIDPERLLEAEQALDVEDAAGLEDADETEELDGRPTIAGKTARAKSKIPEVVSKSSSRALTPADPVSIYLAELRKYPLLTKEQERELAVRYRETGDSKAAELLVTSNLRFVVKIAFLFLTFGSTTTS